jgi:hypothetical protein
MSPFINIAEIIQLVNRFRPPAISLCAAKIQVRQQSTLVQGPEQNAPSHKPQVKTFME